jgi:hypothetical protein
VTELINGLKSHNWYAQGPSVTAIFELDWSTPNQNQIFVLGRNLFQCACGGERKAVEVLRNLRRELARLPTDSAIHLLNGMFFEVYFNKTGEFRGSELKGRCLDYLLQLQTVKKFEPSISFIRRALEPYETSLPFRPCAVPEIAVFDLVVKKSDPPLIKSLRLKGRDLLVKDEDLATSTPAWKLSLVKFTVDELKTRLGEAWNIPPGQMEIKCAQPIDPKTEFRLPKGTILKWPDQ